MGGYNVEYIIWKNGQRTGKWYVIWEDRKILRLPPGVKLSL